MIWQPDHAVIDDAADGGDESSIGHDGQMIYPVRTKITTARRDPLYHLILYRDCRREKEKVPGHCRTLL